MKAMNLGGQLMPGRRTARFLVTDGDMIYQLDGRKVKGEV